ncbi:MAG TPA: hypothetical protein VG757_03720 [Devosia sp.]|nr:hypothetical protein [Devosia sp.]
MPQIARTLVASFAALSLAAAPIAAPVALLGTALSATQAFAKGKPASPGRSQAAHGNSSSASASESTPNIASLAGRGNAAHASVQGLLHASPNSQVGLLRTYADLQFELNSGTLQTEVTNAQAAFDLAYPNFANLTPEEQELAMASPEGIALQSALDALAAATADRDTALAAATENADDPAVQSYIDGLLADYYGYLGTL